jgi:organic radical activating enzyme
MRAEQIAREIGIRPLKFTLRDTPHATIEPNRTCNIQCRSCYNLDRSHVKSLADIQHEIDRALEKRNLGVVTLLGGEPTLHPRIEDIITYIKSKKLYCQLLTNGIILLQDKGDKFLDRLISSGLDKILIHIDIGQSHVHQDIETARRILFSKLEKKKVSFSLSLTVYNEEGGRIPELAKKYSSYRYFDGILAVLARDPLPPRIQDVELEEEYCSIGRSLHIEPVAYIPSNLNDGDVHWLIYFYFINTKTGKTFSPSPVLYRIFRKAYRRIKNREPFTLTIRPVCASWLCLAAGLGEILCHPRKFPAFASLLRGSDLLKAIRFHYTAIQKPPEFNRERNRYQLCYHCPDATIRNGKLTPVCIADQINPLDGDRQSVDEEKYRAAYAHLQEL